ncbi:MAG: flavodoxin [Ruminococcus sp.]
MKKLVSMLMVFTLLFSFTACGNNNNAGESEKLQDSASQTEQQTTVSKQEPDSSAETSSTESNPVETETKSLVAYFSCTGNTKAVAERIAELTGADLYEIVPAEPYTDEDLNYNNNDCRANREMNDSSARPAIGSDSIDISDYDTVYIGYPIWWGTMPRIINTFLDTYDLSNKTVMPFCTSGGSGVSKSVSDIKAEEPDADIRDGLRASGSSDSGIDEWLSNNGLIQ